MIRFEDCSCCTYTICANSERVTLSQIPLLFLNNFLLLIQCSVVFGGRYMCICQTCVSVQVCSFLQSFPCHLQRHNYTIYMYVLLSQKMYLVQFWEFWKNKKIKKKKTAFSQGKRVRHWSMAVAWIFKVNFFSGESNIHHKLQLLEP